MHFVVAPQILPFDFGEETVNSGDMASLTCSVHKGDLPLDIFWLHNNKDISPETAISLFRTNNKISTLSIDSVQEQHAGSYTCIARNAAGTSSFSTWLHVNGTFKN